MLKCWATILFLTGGIYLRAKAEGSFSSPIRVSNSGGAISSVSADLDGDGAVEFISAASSDSGSPHFRIYKWNGSGFTIFDVLSPAVVAARKNRFGGDLAVGDMDGDGWKDIVVPESNNNPGQGKVSWFKNPGSLGATWQEIVVSTWSGTGTGNVAEHMADIAVGDINSDGKQDIVTRDVRSGFWVMIQISGGTNWETRKFVPANPREGLTLWDPDRDGDMDILLNGVWFETPSDPVNGDYIQKNILGAEAWYPTNVTSTTVADYACQVETGDFNRDGKTDFVISNAEKLLNSPLTSTKPLGVRVYLAPSDILNDPWTEVILHTNFFSWHSCEVGDINGDGSSDIVTGISQVGEDNEPGRVTAFLNDATGAFIEQTIAFGKDAQATPIYIYNPSIGDADGDGDLDIFATDNWNSGPIRYFQNEVPFAVGQQGLKIFSHDQQVTISWPITLTGYKLEYALGKFTRQNTLLWNTHPGPYTTNTQNIIVTEHSVTENIGNGGRFYRLRRPE